MHPHKDRRREAPFHLDNFFRKNNRFYNTFSNSSIRLELHDCLATKKMSIAVQKHCKYIFPVCTFSDCFPNLPVHSGRSFTALLNSKPSYAHERPYGLKISDLDLPAGLWTLNEITHPQCFYSSSDVCWYDFRSFWWRWFLLFQMTCISVIIAVVWGILEISLKSLF